MAEAGEAQDAGSPAADSSGVDGLGQLLGLARRRAGLIAGSAACCTALAAVYVLLQTPVYRATAELLVAPQALQVVGRDIVRPDSSASLDFANVDSQSLVMLSTPVLRRVAAELDLAADPAFQPHPGMLSGLLARVSGPGPEPSAAQREAEVLELLKASLVIHRVENALVFQITASNPRAARAAEIANALAAAYLRVTAQERVDSVKRADTSVISQVAGLREQLDAADAAVERFRSANGLTKSSADGLVVTQQLKDLYTQIDAAGAEASRLAAKKEQVSKLGPEALLADTVPDALNSPTLIALRAQYANLAREAASQARTLLPQHPRMLELNAELAEAQKQLRAELARVRGSVSDSVAQANNNLARLQARAAELTRSKNTSSEAETKLRQLESEAQAIRAVFDASLGRARELEQQGKIQTSNSRLLSEATAPLRPTKPPLAVVLAAAALFGACLGLGLGYLLDRLPRRSVRQSERRSGGGRVVPAPRDAGELRPATAPSPRPPSRWPAWPAWLAAGWASNSAARRVARPDGIPAGGPGSAAPVAPTFAAPPALPPVAAATVAKSAPRAAARPAARLTPRDAGRLLGVGATVLPPPAGRGRLFASGAGDDGSAAAAALGPVVAGLRTTLRGRLPALVAVVAVRAGARGGACLRAAAEPLGQALADLGEEVLFCDGGDPSGSLAVRRLAASASATASSARPSPDERGEFIVTAVDLDRARPAALEAARAADAIVLVADLGETDAEALLAAAGAVDPARRRILALLVVDAPAPRRSRSAPLVEAVA